MLLSWLKSFMAKLLSLFGQGAKILVEDPKPIKNFAMGMLTLCIVVSCGGLMGWLGWIKNAETTKPKKPSVVVMPSVEKTVRADETPKRIPSVGPIGVVHKLNTGFTFAEGPAADGEGNVYFSDTSKNRILKVDPDGNLSVFREGSNNSNALMLNAKGEIVACEKGVGQIAAYSPDGKSRRVLAEMYQGKRFNGPYDLVIDRQGGIYFTDPELWHRTLPAAPLPKALLDAVRRRDVLSRAENALPQGKKAIYYIAASGEVTRLIEDQLDLHGITLSPDEKTLYVSSSRVAEIMAYPVESPGKLGKGRTFCTLQHTSGNERSGGDGMTVDSKGDLYITSGLSLQVFDPSGKALGSIALPERPSNVTFGGSDLKTLYVTALTSLYTVPMEVRGHLFALRRK